MLTFPVNWPVPLSDAQFPYLKDAGKTELTGSWAQVGWLHKHLEIKILFFSELFNPFFSLGQEPETSPDLSSPCFSNQEIIPLTDPNPSCLMRNLFPPAQCVCVRVQVYESPVFL